MCVCVCMDVCVYVCVLAHDALCVVILQNIILCEQQSDWKKQKQKQQQKKNMCREKNSYDTLDRNVVCYVHSIFMLKTQDRAVMRMRRSLGVQAKQLLRDTKKMVQGCMELMPAVRGHSVCYRDT